MSHQRQRERAGPQGVQLSLIVTPMLDMSFQILAFFIMTYHPSALEAHIPGSLAPDNPAIKDPKMPADPAPDLIPLPAEQQILDEMRDAITVKVKAIGKNQEAGMRTIGTPSQVFVKSPLEIDGQLLADVDVDFDVALKRLATHLREIRKKAGAPTDVKIAADGELRQQYVMRIYDAVKGAGFERIHFVPPPLLNAKFSK